MPRPLKRTAAPPLWRDFEKLVARIEQVVAGSGVSVTSPDRVRSLITGRKREVDASIRTTVGSAEVLVTIECRRRKAKQDVTWLEQLGCKRQALGAARTIAVSSSPFTSDAIRVARHYGVDLRVLSEINETEIREWVLPQSLIHIFKQCDLKEGTEILFEASEGDDAFTAFPPEQSGDGVVTSPESVEFVCPDGSRLTLNELWLKADEQHRIFEGVPTDDQVHFRRVTVTPSDTLQLRTRLGERRVRKIVLV